MQANFESFEEKYGGKIFVIFSSKVGNKKEVKNKEVLDEITAEIARLKWPWGVAIYRLHGVYLHNASFVNCKNIALNSSHQFPLEEKIKNYIHYHLTNIYKKAIRFSNNEVKIPEKLITEFENITNKNSINYILNQQHYHCAVHAQLSIGVKNV